MDGSIISAEQIGFALRQAESGVPIDIITDSLSVDRGTFDEWRRRYSELFQSMVLGRRLNDPPSISIGNTKRPNLEASCAYILHQESDAVFETALREFKIRHTAVRDVLATVSELLGDGKKVGFLHGALRFNVQEFGAPTLLNEKAHISLQEIVAPSLAGRVIERRAQIKAPTQPSNEPESAFLVVGAEIAKFVKVDRRCEEPRQQFALQEEVDRLYGLRSDQVGVEHARVLLWEGQLTISMQAIARDARDAIRTFFTTDLDVMILANYLLAK